MKKIEAQLRKEMKELESIINRSKKALQNVPEGYLRIVKKERGVEYYYKDENRDRGKNGRYIKKKEMKLAERIAQRDYDTGILANAEERKRAIKSFLEKYERTDLKKVYQKISPHRRELISPAILPEEEYIKAWQEVKYNNKGYKEETPEIITERGERVRSKSEKIIADKLNLMGVPYRYEYPLLLGNHLKVYPDFTILNIATKEEVYLEHFGMMDDREYVESVVHKLNTYGKNGIFPGVNLFITYETSKNPLNVKALDELIRKRFCAE
ncbi:MAG: hypothetical protein ACI4DN_01840 [Lachnospiraceae bacterium]